MKHLSFPIVAWKEKQSWSPQAVGANVSRESLAELVRCIDAHLASTKSPDKDRHEQSVERITKATACHTLTKDSSDHPRQPRETVAVPDKTNTNSTEGFDTGKIASEILQYQETLLKDELKPTIHVSKKLLTTPPTTKSHHTLPHPRSTAPIISRVPNKERNAERSDDPFSCTSRLSKSQHHPIRGQRSHKQLLTKSQLPAETRSRSRKSDLRMAGIERDPPRCIAFGRKLSICYEDPCLENSEH